VVSLTLDRSRYELSIAHNRREALTLIRDIKPHLVFVSDRVSDITASSFPREAEALLAKDMSIPPFILISQTDAKNTKNFVAVLKKPFSPQELQQLVSVHALASKEPTSDIFEDRGDVEGADPLQKMFDRSFSDEARLVKETLEGDLMNSYEKDPAHDRTPPPAVSVEELWHDRSIRTAPPPKAPEPVSELWSTRPGGPKPTEEVLGTAESVAFKESLQSRVEDRLKETDLLEIVDKVLEKVVPPIVERLVQERLDKLLQEQERFVETKP